MSACASDGVLTICRPGPMREVRREAVGERWCFVCRRRREFVFTVMSEIELSYYGPHPAIKCENGHRDGDLGFGRYREWE